MKTSILRLAFIFIPALLFAEDQNAIVKRGNWALDFGVRGGYRTDDFDWNIQGRSGFPNVLSELSWTDLQIPELKTTGTVVWKGRWIGDASFSIGNIADGISLDSDYAGDNRTFPWARSVATTDAKHIIGYSFSGGYRFQLPSDVLEHLTLTAGYASDKLHMADRAGRAEIPIQRPFQFQGVISKYDAEWYGPWAGAAVSGSKGKVSGSIAFQYHFGNYYGVADWVLRTDFQHPKSFEDEADASGTVLDFAAGYELHVRCCSIQILFIGTGNQTLECIARSSRAEQSQRSD